MIGKINYKAGSLIQLENFASLPNTGSESVTYYVREDNAFYVYNSNTNKYTRLKTRPTTWFLSPTTLLEEQGKELNINSNELSNLEPGQNNKPDVGDMIYDSYGACGVIIDYAPSLSRCIVRTLDSSVSKRVTYDDGSWEMWLSKEEGGGHYYWDFSTNVLTYEGVNNNPDSPVSWESYSIIGGAVDYTITGGTRVGVRKFLAWDSGVPGTGTLRFYYTKNNNDYSFNENDEVATLRDVHSMITSDSGIYCGHSNTVTTLNKGDIEGYPSGHTLSNNDWAYVLHYDENSKPYAKNASYKVNDIIEYNGLLYIVKTAFTASNWSTDSSKVLSWDGETYSFIYRTGAGWTKGTKLEQDNFEPDEVRLTKTLNNKMTIKAGGVDTQSLADSAVTTNKINNNAITTAKIANNSVTRAKLSAELQNVINKGDTMWYSGNLIVSTTQPAAPATGYILWVNANPNSI